MFLKVGSYPKCTITMVRNFAVTIQKISSRCIRTARGTLNFLFGRLCEIL